MLWIFVEDSGLRSRSLKLQCFAEVELPAAKELREGVPWLE